MLKLAQHLERKRPGASLSTRWHALLGRLIVTVRTGDRSVSAHLLPTEKVTTATIDAILNKLNGPHDCCL